MTRRAVVRTKKRRAAQCRDVPYIYVTDLAGVVCVAKGRDLKMSLNGVEVMNLTMSDNFSVFRVHVTGIRHMKAGRS